jgi:uncharacterized membrane protein required for colicin V production
VTTIDWIILAAAAVLGLDGLRRGLIVGVLRLAGLAAGAFAGSRIGPSLLSDGAHSPYAPLFALGGAAVLGAVLAGGLEVAGQALRRIVPIPGARTADSLLGALLGVVLALGAAWVLGAVALQTPALQVSGLDLRRDVQRSKVLAFLNDRLPPSGFLLNALARVDPRPKVHGQGATGIAPVAPAIAHEAGVHAAAGSVVRVLGTACGLGVEGSGWAAGGSLVVTNAHVVAGERDTVVQVRGSGPELRARAVVFDPEQDVAVLRVSGLDAPRLALAPAAPAGAEAAVLGFPLDGGYRVRSARLGQTQDVLSQDAYGRGEVRRSVLAFRGVVEHGNSGGPVVDASGRVAGTVFAATVGDGPHGGYAVPNVVVAADLRRAGGETVSTGPCAR